MEFTLTVTGPVTDLPGILSALGGSGTAVTTAPPARPKKSETAAVAAVLASAPAALPDTPPVVANAPAESTDEPAASLEQVRLAVTNAAKAGKSSNVRSILAEFGACKVTELKKEDYAAVLSKIQDLPVTEDTEDTEDTQAP